MRGVSHIELLCLCLPCSASSRCAKKQHIARLAMPAMKRPAASEATSGAPTKKPAANKLTINAMVDDIKTAASSKDDEEENQLRDKGKAEKFGKLMKAGALPLAVVHMWQIESKKAQSQRQFQTNLINGLFNKQTDGSYKMNPVQRVPEDLRPTRRQGQEEGNAAGDHVGFRFPWRLQGHGG